MGTQDLACYSTWRVEIIYLDNPLHICYSLIMFLSYFLYFLIGAFLGNGMPHFIWGRSNTIARSPFGQQTKPKVNFRWGLANLIAATLLSLWQISVTTISGGDIIMLLIGYWVMVAQFGFGIKRFIHQ